MTDSDEPISPDETAASAAEARPGVSLPEADDAATKAAPEPPHAAETIDLDAIEADLDDVQSALGRLADGSYWTDEVTGEPIPADVLVANPLTRRN